MASKAPTSPDLAARALSHVTETREAARERLRRDNPDLAWVATYRDMFGPIKDAWVRCEFTGREWGKDICQRVREAGGKGIAVQASASCRPGKPLKERK